MLSTFKPIKNILIRGLKKSDQEMIALIKEETGFYQASKALLTIGHAYLRLLAAKQKDRQKMIDLEEENKRLKTLSYTILKSVKDLQQIINNNIG